MTQRLRWAPAVLVFVVLLAAWAAVLAGGFARVIAWSLGLPLGVSFIAVPVLVATIARAIWIQKLTRPILATLACAVVGVWGCANGVARALAHERQSTTMAELHCVVPKRKSDRPRYATAPRDLWRRTS